MSVNDRNVILEGYAHPTEFGVERKPLQVFATVPEAGVNADTGLLVVSLGFANPPENRFFTKLRYLLADRFNVVCIGVGYLGTDAMRRRQLSVGEYDHANTRAFLTEVFGADSPLLGLHETGPLSRVASACTGADLSGIFYLTETISEYTHDDYIDYGLIQALDLVNSVGLCMKHFTLNSRRIFAMGSSLGAFVVQMANKFAPHTFAAVIDVSAPVTVPPELFLKQHISKGIYDGNNTCVSLHLDSFYDDQETDPHYLAPWRLEIRNLGLAAHYQWGCSARILMLMGTEDPVFSLQEKVTQFGLYRQLGFATILIPIGIRDIDGKMFTHPGHSLGADWLLLIEHFGDAVFHPKLGDRPDDFANRSEYVFTTSAMNHRVQFSEDHATLSIEERL